MMSDMNESPLNPLPPVVWVLVLPMIVLEAAFGLQRAGFAGQGSFDWRTDAITQVALQSDLVKQLMILGEWGELAKRLLGHTFVHGSFTGALFGIVLTLALGKMVAENFRWWAVLALYFGAATLGAVAFLLVPGNRYVLIGAMPAAYGLIGAFTFLIWTRLIAQGDNGARAFTLIGFLLGAQLLFGLLFEQNFEWVADFVAFATGFALSAVLIRGGWHRMLMRLRNR